MKHTTYYTYGIYSLCFMLLPALFFSCKKTEYENIKRPYNGIQRFAIAGYGGLDSINAVIGDDDLIVYWNADAEPPAKIRPVIAVSAGATVSPASGEEVDFSENTVYTVTAEDGTVREYTLKPVFNEAVPVLFTVPARFAWASPTSLEIVGEYFMAGGDASAIKVYAQRLRDGFEFDIPIDLEKTTKTKIVANLPIMTSELDTGAHRLYVKVGDFRSNYSDIQLMQPALNTIITGTTVDKVGNVDLGDDITFINTIKEGWEDAYARFYNQANFQSLSIGLQPIVGSVNGKSVNIGNDLVTVSGNGRLTVRIDNDFFQAYTNNRVYGGTMRFSGTNYQFSFNNVQILWAVIQENKYATMGLVQDGQQIHLGQELAINYSFLNDDIKNTYQGKLIGLHLGFVNPNTGQYNTVSVTTTNIVDDGSQVKFTLPASATAIRGNALVIFGLQFRNGIQNIIMPRENPASLNTIVAND